MHMARKLQASICVLSQIAKVRKMKSVQFKMVALGTAKVKPTNEYSSTTEEECRPKGSKAENEHQAPSKSPTSSCEPKACVWPKKLSMALVLCLLR